VALRVIRSGHAACKGKRRALRRMPAAREALQDETQGAKKCGPRRAPYFFEAPAAFLVDLFREEEGFVGDVFPPRVSRRVSGMTFGS